MQLKHSRSTRGGGALIQILVFLLCACAILSLGWMLLLPGLFTSVIEQRTGFPARVDYFYANPFTAEVRMRGLAIINPAGFGESDFLELHQFNAKADLFSLLGKSPVLDMTTVDVARITVVTNSRGANNLELMYRRLAPESLKKPAGKPAAPASRTEGEDSLNFLVKNLDVRVNEVVVRDERPGKVAKNIHELAFQRSYHNVTPKTNFSENLPASVTEAGKNIGETVTGDFKQIVTNFTKPIDRKTYAWGDKREKITPGATKLEETAKP
jgi:hypothetical protein